jgi:RNA polymerase sigma-70 factor (ECF subfamily)
MPMTAEIHSPDQLETTIESHRAELTRYCSWKLGSHFDAEDAVQETLVRAWRSADRLQQPAALRSWLYRIAGNVCIDAANWRSRQPPPTDECPDEPYLEADLDPAAVALTREDLRLALMAVQCLPPRQRAVLLLRDILCWRAAEVAEFLATTVAAVNSALQRAHATLEGHDPDGAVEGDDPGRHHLVNRYLAAFEADDVGTLISLTGSGGGAPVALARAA